ncbi:LOW QUALITY PROTEIN: hypothetical protein SPRG_18079 [Saprolegnia parasitica CBS 223.65]|uniref:Uncharacterized protein n=1 Tax=Saprolegnia parasitica (strain CBS 223.65) TaxID=695850 RepID=A0A067BI33_SAPPC|nr:LOW QUALITY PROTEIN: hypothetical protein SPRG_18079 [Saprolegnia parasitica CBS 223.65]KDO16395.1 LOW QUALITY PROTEIN: hypothetical protein SPRG_18079 [Saprolegnia parasitica CBS 223.65]|eukprot:XP_012212897.1 LOW QUALITY PROTEIN: hypothetical protein SPRG_18079 [Saprolegnia parasitica CBS 223.65]
MHIMSCKSGQDCSSSSFPISSVPMVCHTMYQASYSSALPCSRTPVSTDHRPLKTCTFSTVVDI